MSGIASWELFEDIRDTQDEILRMNRMRAQRFSLFGQHNHPAMSIPAWAPAIDIYERKDAYLVAAELPGVGISRSHSRKAY
jgi:HSP20 family molecular chaperone IbpA